MQHQDWQKLWLDQSKIFMEITNKSLQDLFNQQSQFNPQQHLQQMQAWAELMNKQWLEVCSSCTNADQERYWEAVAQTSKQACDLMLQQWQQKLTNDQPIKSAKELYELWLSACHDIHMKNIQSNAYQMMYGDMLNNAMQFWKTTINK